MRASFKNYCNLFKSFHPIKLSQIKEIKFEVVKLEIRKQYTYMLIMNINHMAIYDEVT